MDGVFERMHGIDKDLYTTKSSNILKHKPRRMK